MRISDWSSDVCSSDLNVAALEAVAAECATETLVLPFEATDYAALPAIAQQAWAWRGRVDGLVNNAGISQRSLAIETDSSVYERIVAVDLLALIALTQHLLPRMVGAAGGRKIGRVPRRERECTYMESMEGAVSITKKQ